MGNPVRTGIEDRDRPLHRIFPVWHLERLCRLRQLVLVKPKLWIDPREDPCASFFVQDGGVIKHQVVDQLAACWAQCWSYEDDSDVLLRAYSRVVLDPLIQRNTAPAEEGDPGIRTQASPNEETNPKPHQKRQMIATRSAHIIRPKRCSTKCGRFSANCLGSVDKLSRCF